MPAPDKTIHEQQVISLMFNRMRAATFVSLLLATALPAITINTAVAQAQSPTRIASTVLATVNGQQLTQVMVNWYIEFGEFLAGHKFSEAEKRWYTDLKIKHFRKNANEEMQGYKEIKKILTQIRQLRNPIKLAQAREKFMAGIHLNRLANNRVNEPSPMTIVYKYSPVLYTNPKYKVVVTKRTVDSMNVSRNLVAKIVGKPLEKPNYKQWTQMLQQLDFKALSPKTINHIATAESRSVTLQVALSKASPRQRRKITNHIKQLMQQRGTTLSNIARNLESEVPKFVSAGEVRVPNIYQYRMPRLDLIVI